MTKYGQIGWRVAAAAAFAATAGLAVMLTRVPAAPRTALFSDVAGRACPASGLEAWLGSAENAYYTLEFTNVSHRACRLYGYPEVSAYASGLASGGPIGGAASRDTAVRPQPVTLAPGATAHAVLRITAGRGGRPSGCARVTAEELRVSLPRQGQPAFVLVHIPVCAGKGRASFSVQPVQPRPGVPGSAVLP
jgi:hypothetical protein